MSWMHSGGSSALYGDVYASPNKSLEQTFWRNSGGAVKSKPATPEMNNCNATIGESVQVHHSRRLQLREFRLWGSYSSGQRPGLGTCLGITHGPAVAQKMYYRMFSVFSPGTAKGARGEDGRRPPTQRVVRCAWLSAWGRIRQKQRRRL